MDLAKAFGPDVDPDAFFTEMFPELFAEGAADLAKVTDVPIVLGVRFDDDDDYEYTVTLSPDGAEVEEGEGFEPPLATLVGLAEYWDALRGELHELAKTLEKLAEKGRSRQLPAQYRLTAARVSALQRLSGHFKLELTDVPGADAPVPATVLIGDFYDEGDTGLTATIAFEDFQKLVRGQVSPGRLRNEGRIKIHGDMKFPMTLAGTYMAS